MIDINRCLQAMGHDVNIRIISDTETKERHFIMLGTEDWILARGDQQTIIAALNIIFHPSKDNYVLPTYGGSNAD